MEIYAPGFFEGGLSRPARSFPIIFSVIASETSEGKSNEPVSVTIFTVLQVES
jgi:hypothetical protein